MSLAVGDKAPEFTTIDQNGESVSLAQFQGKKVVLYFYPKDSTPGCTNQACNLRDNHQALIDAGFVVLGISPDSPKRHQNFIKKNELPFTLLCDEDKSVHELYGTWQLKKFMGREYMGTVRTTFIIDEQGQISDIINKVKTQDHAAQILD